jgi:tRNA A37 threonylcarbamoyltransferase TsaD
VRLPIARTQSPYDSSFSGLKTAVLSLWRVFLDLEAEGFKVHIPAMRFCTDNAAMVGASAYFNPLSKNQLNIDVFSR